MCELMKSSKSRCKSRCRTCVWYWLIVLLTSQLSLYLYPDLKSYNNTTRTLILNKTGFLKKANSNKYGKLPPIYSSTDFNYDDTYHRLCFIDIFCCPLVSSLAISIPFFIGIGDHRSSALNRQWSVATISTLRPVTSSTCHTIIGITYHCQSSHRVDTVFF